MRFVADPTVPRALSEVSWFTRHMPRAASSVLLGRTRVYAGDWDGHLVAWDGDGDECWKADAEDRGEALIGGLRARMKEIADRAEAIADRPTVGCIEWIDPLMAAGNWIPELVKMAGGENVLARPGSTRLGSHGKHFATRTRISLSSCRAAMTFLNHGAISRYSPLSQNGRS